MMSTAPPISGHVIMLPGAELQTVARLNHEHGLACSSRDQAVEHAVRCGQLLLAQKDALAHGRFMEWIATNCDFGQSTATRYMTAAKQIATGIAISSLTSLFPSGRRPALLETPTDVQTPALQAAPVTPIVGTTADEFSIDQAIAALEVDGSSDSRRRLAELKRTDELVKKHRRNLERAEIAQRNAAASVIAAARKSVESW